MNYRSFLVTYRSEPPTSNIFASSQNSLTHLLENDRKSSFDQRSQNGIACGVSSSAISTAGDEEEGTTTTSTQMSSQIPTSNGAAMSDRCNRHDREKGRDAERRSSTAKTALLQADGNGHIETGGGSYAKPRQVGRKKTRLILAAGLFLLLTLLFAAAIVAYLNSPCTSRSCVLTASQILSKMDETVKPCDNFYLFSCGNWIKSSINLNYDMWNALYETSIGAHNTLVDAMLKVIKNESSLVLNPGELAAVELFRQCTDMERLQNIGLSTWLQFADDIGGWLPELFSQSFLRPSPHLLEDAILQSFKYSVFPLFWAGVEVNYQDSKSYLITIYEQVPLLMQPKLYAGVNVTADRILNERINKNELPIARILQMIGEEVAELLSMQRNDTRVRRLVAEMIEFEYRITLSGSTFYASEQQERYEIITLGELQKIAPAIDWKYFLSSLVGIDLPPHERIALKSHEHIALKTGREWIVKLSKIIAEYSSTERGVTILKNYIKWKLLFFHLAYVKPKCAEGDLWTVLKMYSGPSHLRKEFCILRASGIYPISLPSILRKVDGKEKSDKNKDYILKMASDVKREYLKVLDGSEVLDNQTISVVHDKIRNLSVLASYPRKIDDEAEMLKESKRISTELFWSMARGASEVYKEKLARLRKQVDPDDWVDSRPALSLTPIHNYERNLVQIPFDVVRAPYVDSENFLDFMNYATLASVLGHEFTHAFDRQGKLHGPTGNLGKWWSENSMQKVEDREKCFLKQYEGLIGRKEDAEKSLYENIADQVGLVTSFKAWKEAHPDGWLKISGLEKYTPTQLFFVAYAQGWCAHKTSKSREVHSPEDIRVLGALQNSRDFSEAFGCATGTKMNPTTKCSLW